MSSISRSRHWLNKPWLHFALIGALAYGLLAMRSDPGDVQRVALDATDEARIERQWKMLGAGAERYVSLEAMREQALTEKVLYLEALKLDFHRQDPAIRQRLLATLDILDLEEQAVAEEDDPFETAIALGLHLGDEVVRQRMVLMMQVALESMSTPQSITDADVRESFLGNPERWVVPAKLSFSHAFLGDRGATEPATQENAEAVDSPVDSDWAALDLDRGLARSKPFLTGYRFAQQRYADVENLFGEQFAQTLFSDPSPLGVWQLPIRSAFGAHAVWLEDYVAERPMTLDEAHDRIRQELEAVARAKARADEVNRLRLSYGLDPLAKR